MNRSILPTNHLIATLLLFLVSLSFTLALVAGIGASFTPAIAIAAPPIDQSTSGRGNPTMTPTPFPTDFVTPSVTTTQTSSPSTPSATATCVPSGTYDFITMENNYFDPATLTIPAGTTVLWTNRTDHSYAHTTTSDTGLWDSGPVSDGQQFSYTFYTPGIYAYHCTIHSTMHGTVNVLPAQPCGTSTPRPPTATRTATSTSTALATSTATVEPTTTACTISFTDVPADSTFYQYIRCLACRGIISGYSDGTFRPNNDITRGQIAKIVSNAAGFNDDPGPQVYEDVPVGSPFYAWVNRLSNLGFMGGYECGLIPEEPCIPPDNRPYFRPNASATRGQLSKIVANAAGLSGTPTDQFYADVPTGHTFYLWIMRLTTLGVMGGYDCGGPGEPCDSENRPYFRPFNNVTRGQASKIVANTFLPDCQTPARR